MQVELKDILTWAAFALGFLAQWFTLKSRVTIIEALQKRDRETVRESFKEIKEGIQRIEDKLDHKADK